jgi:hypothetical protein
MKLTEAYNKYLTYKAKREEGLTRLPNPFNNLPFDPPASVVDELSRINLVRNSDGKVNTTKTVTNITDSEQRAAIALAYKVPRSTLLIKPAAKKPEFASLTPLLMYAHKRDHGVKYEEWDKTDENIVWATGAFLVSLISKHTKFDIKELMDSLTLEKIKNAREQHLGESKKVTDYGGSSIEFELNNGETVKLLGTNPITKMILQGWIAHSSIRVPHAMILDPFNWDNIPEPLDIEIEGTDNELPWGFDKPKDKDDDLPW